MLGWMCVICVITDVQINFNEASFLFTLAFYSHIVKGIKPAMLNQIEAHHPANSINDTTYKTPTSSWIFNYVLVFIGLSLIISCIFNLTVLHSHWLTLQAFKSRKFKSKSHI